MTQRVQLYRSTVAGHVPASLLPGELGANLTDKKLWLGSAAGAPLDLGAAFNAAAIGSTALTGLVLSSSAAVTATDNALSALGKLQAQITLRAPINNPTFTGIVTGDLSGGTVTTRGTNRALSVRFTETFNVLDYGAKGDGTTDDSTAFQNAINDAAAAHGEVYIPPSAAGYLINTCLVANDKTSFSIRGATATPAQSFDLARNPPKAGSVLIGNTGTGKAVLELIGSNGITLRDFMITTVGAATPSTRGILWGTGNNGTYYVGTPGSGGMYFANVHVLLKDPLGTGESIPFYGNNANTSVLIGCSSTGNYGLCLVSNNPLSVTPQYRGWGPIIQSDGNYVAGCSFLGFGAGQPLYLEGANCSTFDQIYICLLNGGVSYTTGNPYAVYIKDCTDVHMKVEQDYFPVFAHLLGALNDVRVSGIHFPYTTPQRAGFPALFYMDGTSIDHCDFLVRPVGMAAPSGYHYSMVGTTTPTMTRLRNSRFAFDVSQIGNVIYGNVVNGGGVPYFNLRFDGDADTTNYTFGWSTGGVTAATPLTNIRSFWNGKAVGTG